MSYLLPINFDKDGLNQYSKNAFFDLDDYRFTHDRLRI